LWVRDYFDYDVDSKFLCGDKQVLYVLQGKRWKRDRFKVGGCRHFSLLKKRLSSYNCGTPEECKSEYLCLFSVDDYRLIESKLKVVLKDNRENKSEIYKHLNYETLRNTISYVSSQQK
jgi:hypothetical protein